MSMATVDEGALRVDNKQMRVDLAASFRLVEMLDLHEAVANHFSLALPGDGSRFLINPKWRHFGRLRASDLLEVDFNDKSAMERPDAPDLTAWCLHGALHAHLPRARCIMHAHPPYTTAIACLADPDIKPVDQNTARFFNRVAIDRGYEGMASSLEEGVRLAKVMGNRGILLMGNHGVVVTGQTVAEAFDMLYYLERSCRTLVLAYSTGQPLKLLSPAAAEVTAREWEVFGDAAEAHFRELQLTLSELQPNYGD